ncbi:MAG: metallophosphoesterase family protein [Oscillospiraceae bacterium]|nr:metallophosphoesterase family protein [Oscillospiraceae bacterium]
MKLLLISDIESPLLWDHFVPGRLDDVDLILSCGDLKPEYLSFLVTMSHARLLYVPGNHDGIYETQPPEGCECVDGRLVTVEGLRILGLGGSSWYNGGPYQYSEGQMRRRIRKKAPALWLGGGVDIVLAHAPIRGLGDQDDPAHRGFDSFRGLVERWHPRYFVHGHVHLNYGYKIPRRSRLGDTEIINAYGYQFLEL